MYILCFFFWVFMTNPMPFRNPDIVARRQSISSSVWFGFRSGVIAQAIWHFIKLAQPTPSLVAHASDHRTLLDGNWLVESLLMAWVPVVVVLVAVIVVLVLPVAANSLCLFTHLFGLPSKAYLERFDCIYSSRRQFPKCSHCKAPWSPPQSLFCNARYEHEHT